MNECHILGLGETCKLWDGKGYSIGVNDIFGRGIKTDALVVVDNFRKYHERYRIIQDSRPREFFSQLTWWRDHPNYKEITLRRFKDIFKLGTIYSSNTTPIIAMSIAAKKGFKEIVLHGVDFVDHKVCNGKALTKEIIVYLKFITELEKLGIKVYLYSNYGALSNQLPVWQK